MQETSRQMEVNMGLGKRFDWHQWAPTVCVSAKEIDQFLTENNVYGKSIISVNVIGMAENMEKSMLIQSQRTTLASAGIPYDVMDSGSFPYMEEVLLPCEVTICEPVVLIFDDNSTLEMQMCRNGTVKFSVNQIPATVHDGTNRCNVRASQLFGLLSGCIIRRIYLISCTTESSTGAPYVETRTSWKLEFNTSGDYGFYLESHYGSWYRFGVCAHHHHTYFGWETAKIPYRQLAGAAIGTQQIPIVEGHDCSSYFWIMPVKAISKQEEWNARVEEYRPEEISIEECDVDGMLYYFLDQVYDPSLQEPFRDMRLYGLDFEWNLEYNVFTYESIRKMLSLIREYTQLLQTDYDSPKLDALKECFYPGPFDSEYYYYRERPSREEVIRKNVFVAIDFYERFCNRMERMMKYAPQFDLISFMGP